MENNNSTLISPVSDMLAMETQDSPNFIEGPSNAITLEELKTKCIVPSWANGELCISHQNFIEAVVEAAKDVFPRDYVGEPEIRVSHAQHSRIPSALHKKVSELLDSEKTLYYQRVCFCCVVSMKDEINGKEARITVGGVRALNNENLGTKKGLEKFKLFIGYRISVCSNLCIFGDAVVDKLEVTDDISIYERAVRLFQGFDPAHNKYMLESLHRTMLTTDQFTHILGKCRLYEALSLAMRKDLELPQIILGDQIFNAAARNFVSNPDFGVGNRNQISCFDCLNLLNESCKSSYIDRFLEKNVNATDFVIGICEALNGAENSYSWFLR